MILLQQLQVDPGLAVKAVKKGLGNKIAQVFITLSVFAQEHQVIALVVDAVGPVRHPAGGYIHFAADDGLDPCRLGGFVEVDAAVHHSVVRNGHGSLAQLLDPVHHGINAAGTV